MNAQISLDTKIFLVDNYTPYSIDGVIYHDKDNLRKASKQEPEFTQWLKAQYAKRTPEEQKAYRSKLQNIMAARRALIDEGGMNRFNNFHTALQSIEQVLAGTFTNENNVYLQVLDPSIKGNYSHNLILKPGGIIDLREETNDAVFKQFKKYHGKNINEVPTKVLEKILTPVRDSFRDLIDKNSEKLTDAKVDYHIMRVAVNLETPIVRNFGGMTFVGGPYQDSALGDVVLMAEQASKDKDIDGAIFENIKDPHLMTSYLILSPEQIHIFGSEGDIQGFQTNVASQRCFKIFR
jgi:hypothetical protein